MKNFFTFPMKKYLKLIIVKETEKKEVKKILILISLLFLYSMYLRSSKLKSKSSGHLRILDSKADTINSLVKPQFFQPFCSNLMQVQKKGKGLISPISPLIKSSSKDSLENQNREKVITCSVNKLFKRSIGKFSRQSSKISDKTTLKNKLIENKKKLHEFGECSKATQATEMNSNKTRKNPRQEYLSPQRKSRQESMSILKLKNQKQRKKTSQKQKHIILSFANSSHHTVSDKINYHLQVLSILSDFVESWWRSNKDQQEWEELYFLIYKKYYLEKVKVQKFLKKHPIKNPFRLNEASINTGQMVNFMKLYSGKICQRKVAHENMGIKEKLRDYYNFIINKSGGHINLLEVDNFSEFIYKQLWNSFIMVEFSSRMCSQRKKIKMCRILQIAFIISELEGKIISPLYEAQQAIQTDHKEEYIIKNRKLYKNLVAE